MSFVHNTTIACILLLATPALASAEWYHASAPGGQYEGGYDGGEFFINYGCSLSSSVSFIAKGAFVAAGDASISVDGVEIYAGAATYNSSSNTSKVEISVESDYGKALLTEFNNILKSIAAGNEVSWTYPDGTTFTSPLTNSSSISSCQVYTG